MRTILLGIDFMYNSKGELVPLEMNTNSSFDLGCLENNEEVFDLFELSKFIEDNNFSKVIYIGGLKYFSDKLKKWVEEKNLEFEEYRVVGSTTVPYVEDNPSVLIIRSAFDGAALVDEEYCVNKINFMELIKDTDFSTEIAYMNYDGTIINHITEIPDNDEEPNFILKAIYPHYDKNDYPKFFKVKNLNELNQVIENNVNSEFFLMRSHYNPDTLYNDQIQVIRSYNILFPPNLENISLGAYTKITSAKIDKKTNYNPITFEIEPRNRKKYLSNPGGIYGPKLLDTDLVEMADGTFRAATELQIGDLIKTIDIPNPDDANLANGCNSYNINYDEFLSGTTYTENRITYLERISTPSLFTTITFTDGTTREDSNSSSYLILRDNNVQFAQLDRTPREKNQCSLEPGDQIILINSADDQISTILKEVKSIKTGKLIFEGWVLTVEEEHLFLTKPEDSESTYVAIEHNYDCLYKLCCTAGCGGCLRTSVCCYGWCSPFFACTYCS